MSRLNRTQAILLDLSGELPTAARDQLHAQIAENPDAFVEYQALCQQFALMQSLPIPEPSAAQRRAIPAEIKQALRQAISEQKQAGHRRVLMRRAGLLVGVVVLIAMFTLATAGVSTRQGERAQVARINATIDRLAARLNPPGEPSVSAAGFALRLDSPSRDTSYDGHYLANLLDPWNPAASASSADLPTFDEFTGTPVSSDPSGPPGSN